MNLIFNNPNDPNMFLLAIFIGMITFSIPFLWNAYQNILNKKKHTTGEKIKNILTKEFYLKGIKLFERWVQCPVGIFVFLGLFIVPIFFPFELGIIFLMVVFLYFLFLPQIFQKIEDKSTTDLKDFLLYKKAESSDIVKAFQELWQKNDDDTEKDFSIKPTYAFKCFSQKINQLVDDKQVIIIREYFNDFLASINNRSIIFLVSEEVFPKILEWYFQVWGKREAWKEQLDELNENELEESLNYREIGGILDSIIEIIQKRALQERASFPFFERLKKHIGKYQKVTEAKLDNLYAKYFFMKIFCPVFFENVTDSPEGHDIWEHYFPREWEITKNSLEDKGNIIPNIILHAFLQWAQDRILNREEKFDEKLDNVSKNLFPEVEPIKWAKILIFVLSPYGESRVKSMIEECPWNFGYLGRTRAYYLGNTKEELLIQSEQKIEIRNTFELARFLFPQEFSKENLEKYMKELKELKYPKESRAENKKLRLLNVFSEMLKF